MSKKLSKHNPNKVGEFKPLPSMRVWLDTQIEIKSDSPTEISAASGLSKSNWYDWLKKPGFEDWFYAEYERKIRRWRPYLDKIGLSKAPRDYNYWKDMQKFTGRREEPQQTNVQVNIPIFNVMSDEAKDQLEKLYEGSDSSND